MILNIKIYNFEGWKGTFRFNNIVPIVKKDAHFLFFFVNCDVSIVFKLYKNE